MCRTVILGLLTLMALLSVSEQGPQQRHLLRELLRHYNRMERPVANDSLPLTVRLSYTLLQVLELDEKNQILITNAWLQMQWYDHYLQWNQSDFPGVKNLRFTTDQIWIPDILLYNSAHDKFDATFKTNILVNSSGHCEYLPPGIFVSTCNVDVRWFPFDIQRCELKFGSWTFDGWLLDIQLKEADVSGFMLNGEWELLEVPGGRNEVFYDCCAEPYPDVTFVVTLRRRTLFYALNLLVPCVLLSSMTLLMFMLPASSGEKISLGITVLLSLTVFSLMIADIMPATSDSVPLIGQYFASTMVIVSMSVVATVIVLQLHHHDHNSGNIPHWVQLVLLHWVPRFLRMKRPERAAQHQCSSGSQSDAPSRTVLSPASSSSHNTNTNASSSILVNTVSPLSLLPPCHPSLQHLHPPHYAKLQPKPQLNGLLPHDAVTTLAERCLQSGWRRSQYASSNRSHNEQGGGGVGETPVVMQQQHLHLLPPVTSTSSSYSFSTVRSPPPFEQRVAATPFDLRRPSNSPEDQGFLAGAETTSGDGGGGPVPACHHAPDGGLAGGGGGGGGGRSQEAESPPPPVGASEEAEEAESEEDQEQKLQMALLLAEVRYLVERAREHERRAALADDWHFAAAVLDRLCLLGFGLFNIVCTIAILAAAPNFGESLSKDFISL